MCTELVYRWPIGRYEYIHTHTPPNDGERKDNSRTMHYLTTMGFKIYPKGIGGGGN